jgi:RNA recognition motif-containing protein
LEALFSNYGQVQEVAVVTDRDTGRPRGFGFVTMDDDGARAAIEALNGNDFEGRALNVNEAKPRTEKRGGGGGGGGRRDRW